MSQITGELPLSEAGGRRTALSSRFYAAAWRWHFYAGLFVAPFLVMLALTGLVMLYSSVFSGRDGEKIAVTPASRMSSTRISRSAALGSARVPPPGMTVPRTSNS